MRKVTALSRAALAMLGAGALAIGISTAAHATVISGSSSAYAESIDLRLASVLGTVTITSAPQPTASGTAPPPYNVNTSEVSLDVGVPVLTSSITAGFLNASAISDVDGGPGSRTTSASASVADLDVSLLNLLGITASVIGSNATVSGDYGALSATGSSNIADLTVLGQAITVTTAPNQAVLPGLLNPLGISITLNEQSTTGDGISSAGISVNAIDIVFTKALLGADVLNGDIILSHSEANEAAVPEPASLALFGTALAGLGLIRRRRRSV